jgi:hypothetical protein
MVYGEVYGRYFYMAGNGNISDDVTLANELSTGLAIAMYTTTQR